MKKTNTLLVSFFSVLAPTLLPAVALTATSANYPTPGLYRVTATGKMAGGTTQNSATEICVGPKQSIDPKTIPGCTPGPGVDGPDGMKFVIKCAGAVTTITTKKVDDKTWRYTTDYKQIGAPSAADLQMGMNHLVTMLEAAEKNAKTDAERADLKKQIAALKDPKGEMAQANRARAAAPPTKNAAGAAGKAGLEATAVTTYTRIADTCPATKAVQ